MAANFDGFWKRPVGLAFAALAMMFFTWGCATAVKPPGAREIQATREEGKAVVLFRFLPHHDAGPSQNDRLSIQIAKMDDLQRLKMMTRNAPSAEAMKSGWFYFLLEPGSYFLSLVLLMEGGQQDLSPAFWFEVPEGEPLIYIGSMRIPCHTKPGFLGRSIARCTSLEISDETAHAGDLARSSFRELGLPATVLMRQHSAELRPAECAGAGPMGFLNGDPASIAAPGWRKRAMGQATGIGRWMDSSSLEALMGMRELGGALAVAYMMYLPLGAAIGAAKGTVEEEKWKPCMEALQEELKTLDLASLERHAMDEALSRRGVSGLISLNGAPNPFDAALENGLKTVLQSRIRRLRITECTERGKFCLDMALHARLWEAESSRTTYSKVFIYSGGPYEGGRPYEVMVWPRPQGREMEHYCSAEGKEIFKREIIGGLQQIAQMIAGDIIAHRDVSAH